MKSKLLLLTAALGLVSSYGWSQVSINSLNSPYTQNFNGLINADGDSATYSDNSTIVGWYVNSEEMDTNTDEYFAEDGSNNDAEVYSFGDNLDTDRALGYVGSSGNNYFNASVRLVNNTGTEVDEIEVSYSGEQWRSGGDTSDNQNFLNFSFQEFSAGSGSVPASTSLTGWTEVNSLDFTAPQPNIAAGALDGNVSANRTSFSNISVSGLTWANGEELWLRWTGNDGTGVDAGLGIDDFSVTAIPEPSSLALIGLTALAVLGILRNRK